jgi:hypothetical protein
VPRALRTLAGVVAAVTLSVLAQTAGAASFAYDAETDVLRLTAATDEVIIIEDTSNSSTVPTTVRYLVSATSAGVSVPWAGTDLAGLVADTVPGSPPEHGLRIEPDVSGGLPLERIEIVDDTGEAEVRIAGGGEPYRDPISVALGHELSLVRVDANGVAPISFGTTSLSISAPEIQLDDDIDHPRDIGLHLVPTQIYSGRQRQQRDLVQRTGRTIGMHGCKRSRMAAVDRTQERKGLPAAQFPEQDAVRA